MSHHVTQCTKLRKSLQPHTSISRQRHGQNHYLPLGTAQQYRKGTMDFVNRFTGRQFTPNTLLKFTDL